MDVFAKQYRLPDGRLCWGLIVERSPGQRERVDAASDFLINVEVTHSSPNTVLRRATSLKFWWQFCLDEGQDPLAPTDPSAFLSKFVIALRSTPKRGRLSSPVRLLPGDPGRRDPKTVAFRVEDVQHFFAWATGAGRVSDPVANQVAAYRKPRYDDVMMVQRLNDGQRATLLKADLNPRDRLVVELALDGLRKGEVLGLQPQDWHPDKGTARAWGCFEPPPHLHVVRRVDTRERLVKSRISRIVPVWPMLNEAMRDYDAWLLEHLPDGLTSKFIVVSTEGHTAGSGLSRGGLDSMWNSKIRTLPGLEKVTRHQCRHTFASELIDAGVDRLIVQQWMGHRNPNSLDVYVHPSSEVLQQAVEKRNIHLSRLGGPA